MIKNWRHKGIKELHETGKSKLVAPKLLARIIRILDLLDEAETLDDLAIPSYQTHRLEVKLGQDLRLRQQLVMTPQLQQAIKILQLSLPELETVVQTELEHKGTNRPRYSMWVNGPWRITFEFEGGNAFLVDLEQYH